MRLSTIARFLLFFSILLLCCDLISLKICNEIISRKQYKYNIQKIQITELNPSISEYDKTHKAQLEFINQYRKKTLIKKEKPIEEVIEIYTEDELRHMACIIYCEAGNQSIAGKQAVGIVVSNRVNSERFEDTVEKVIYEPGQFGPARTGKINKAYTLYDNGTLPQDCIVAAKYALNNNKTIMYMNVSYDMSEILFFNGHLDNAVMRIGDHDFK